ncbi:MAG TPA: hypothetical protein VGN26_12590 [Armatimonadota bacterium]|jgi:hypothetical protein
MTATTYPLTEGPCALCTLPDTLVPLTMGAETVLLCARCYGDATDTEVTLDDLLDEEGDYA